MAEGAARAATRLLPRVSIAWHPTSDQEATLSWSRGYRPGGGNVPVSRALCADDLAAIGRAEAPLGYRGDDTETLDLGYRRESARAAVAVSGFASRWRDVAQQVELPRCGFAYVDNVGRARVRGMEAEARVKPARGLRVDAGLGYVDARLARASDDTSRRGRLPYVPRWSARLTGTWERTLPSGTLLSIGLAHRYAGGFRRVLVASTVPAPLARGPAVSRQDVWVRLSRAALTLELFVRNLGNVRPDLYASIDLVPVNRYPVRTATIRPRTWGLSLTWRMRP